LRRQLNAIKRAQFPWMLAVTKNASQMAIIQLGQPDDAGRQLCSCVSMNEQV